MYKNQLQELAQRSCFNLPSYTSFREGPDHAPRFKSAVNFNGETYESPSYCSTLRQAEHSAAEVALNSLANRGPTNSLAARILDETGVYKNLLQEVSQRLGATLPAYTTFRTGLGHLPVFTGTVELAGVIFTGDPAKSKKQAEKNAAMAAWLSLKSLVQQQSETSFVKTPKDEQEHMTVARALQIYLIKARLARIPFPIKFPTITPKPSSTQPSQPTSSKILPLICPKTAHRNRPITPASSSPSFQKTTTSSNNSHSLLADSFKIPPQNLFPAASAAPYIPVKHCNPHNRMPLPVTVRNTIPVFSTPTFPSPVTRPPTVPVFAASICSKEVSRTLPVVKAEDGHIFRSAVAQVEDPHFSRASPAPNSEVAAVSCGAFKGEVKPVVKVSSTPVSSKAAVEELQESKATEELKCLKIQ